MNELSVDLFHLLNTVCSKYHVSSFKLFISFSLLCFLYTILHVMQMAYSKNFKQKALGYQKIGRLCKLDINVQGAAVTLKLF